MSQSSQAQSTLIANYDRLVLEQFPSVDLLNLVLDQLKQCEQKGFNNLEVNENISTQLQLFGHGAAISEYCSSSSPTSTSSSTTRSSSST